MHLYGRSCDIDSLQSIADKYNLKLLFDAAHAFGCSYKGQLIGCFGDCEVFSFHATKVLNSFEGGAITTNDDELAEKIRLMKNFGFAGMDRVIYIGTNGKMNEACAAMGLTNLEDLEKFISINHRNWNAYKKGLEPIPGIKLLPYKESEHNNYHYVVAEIVPKTSVKHVMSCCLSFINTIYWPEDTFIPVATVWNLISTLYPDACEFAGNRRFL